MEILKNHVNNIQHKTWDEIHGEKWRSNNGVTAEDKGEEVRGGAIH